MYFQGQKKHRMCTKAVAYNTAHTVFVLSLKIHKTKPQKLDTLAKLKEFFLTVLTAPTSQNCKSMLKIG